MKKVLYFLMAAALLASCSKDPAQKPDDKTNPSTDPGKPTGATPTVTISADATFDAAQEATITLTLSEASSSDVKVKLTKGTVEAGKAEVPADFPKNVTIPAGKTTAEIYAEADVLGLESGEYQAAIKIASAEGATVGTPDEVRIGYTFAFKPEVNLYADTQFSSDKTAKLSVALAKAASNDVTVKLVTNSTSTASVNYENTIVIPKGETTKEITVTVNVPDGIENGVYPAIIEIESAENAEIGKSSSVTINLVYPFAVPITLDGLFDDWDNPAITTTKVPEGAKYPDLLEMKLAATASHVFVYIKFNDPGFDVGRPFDLFVDNDGDPSTGYILTSIDNDTAGDIFSAYGGKWYIELALHDGDHYNDFHSWGGVYLYDGPDNTSVFAQDADNNRYLNSIGAFESTMMCAVGSLEDGIGQIEIQMSRKDFEMTGDKARFGAKIMDGANNWKALGILPQGVKDGAFSPVDMLTINLPGYAE